MDVESIEHIQLQNADGVYENCLQLYGKETDIEQFYSQNREEDKELTFHTDATKDRIGTIWLSDTKEGPFVLDTFDVEWDYETKTYFFRTAYIIPVDWVNVISFLYPRIRFTFVHTDKHSNKSFTMICKNGSVIRETYSHMK